MSWIPSAVLFVMMAALGMTLRADDFARLGRTQPARLARTRGSEELEGRSRTTPSGGSRCTKSA